MGREWSWTNIVWLEDGVGCPGSGKLIGGATIPRPLEDGKTAGSCKFLDTCGVTTGEDSGDEC